MASTATVFPKNVKAKSSRANQNLFTVTDDNGYFLCNDYYIPEELLAIILSYLSPSDLVFICRRVCKLWCNLIDSQVWKIKLSRKNIPVQKVILLPWFACFWIVKKSPVGRNLVKNNCGQEKFKHWEILFSGGDGWKIEKPPIGSHEFPKDCIGEDVLEYNSCFATSFTTCVKKQLIDLKKEGATVEFMDIIQPQITITDWYCGRFDCTAEYNLKVRLLNKNYEYLDEYDFREFVGSTNGWTWQKVSYVFEKYGPGVAYIEVIHGGVDSQFWKGHFGSKMTGTSVVLSV